MACDSGAFERHNGGLAVVKSGFPDPVVVGESLAYTVFIVNFGSNTASNVTVTDTLPSDVTYISATADQGSCSETSGVVTCDIGDMGVGDIVQVDIIVTAPSTAGAILNFAEVTSDSTESNTDDNRTEIITQVIDAPPNTTESDLVLLISSPDPVIVGVDFDYTIYVANTGPDDADNVTVTDTLLGSVDIASLSSDCTETDPGTIECTIASLPVGDVAAFSITVNPNGTGTTFNIAQAALGVSSMMNTVQVDPVPSNNTDAITTEVVDAPDPVKESDLFVQKTTNDLVVLRNKGFNYRIVVVNLGPDDATNVTLTDILPTSVDIIDLPVQPTLCTETALMSGTVECAIGTLRVGEVAEFYIRVSPKNVGFIINIAHVSGNEHDPKSSNNISSLRTKVDKPFLDAPDGSDGSNSSGCSSSLVGTPKVGDTAFNLGLLLLPLFIIGVRAVRRRN